MQTINDILNRPSKPFNIDDFGGLKDDEYIKDEVIYCKNCKGNRLFVHNDFRARCRCKCQIEKAERETVEREQAIARQAKMDKFKEISILDDERFKNARFENTETGNNPLFDNAYIRCKKYCDASDQVLRDGLGIYLYGESTGTGKTRLAACVAHELIKRKKTVLLTNFIEISTLLRSTFGKAGKDEADYIESLSSLDFLLIDDIGTERVQTKDGDLYLQEKIYEILNKRHAAKKPTLFTSNYGISQLVTERGFMDKTIDRIAGMSNAILKVEGESYRLKERTAGKLPF